jgi:hypothetical protein
MNNECVQKAGLNRLPCRQKFGIVEGFVVDPVCAQLFENAEQIFTWVDYSPDSAFDPVGGLAKAGSDAAGRA